MNAVARHGADRIADAAAAIRRHGAAVVESVWSADLIDGLREAVLAQHPEFGDPDLLEDFLGARDARFIAPVMLSDRVSASGVLQSQALGALCAALLGDDYVYEAFGMLLVRPGAEAQHPHRDGGMLFPETGIDKILPPSALTIVIPLVDVDAEYAPTGVAAGTHRELFAPDHVELGPVELRRGDIAVWDFRVIHAGLANRTDRARPALYLTACRPFWVDHKNFGETARVKLAGDPGAIAALGSRFVRARAAAEAFERVPGQR